MGRSILTGVVRQPTSRTRLDVTRVSANDAVTENTKRTQEWASELVKTVKRQQKRSRTLRFMLMGA